MTFGVWPGLPIILITATATAEAESTVLATVHGGQAQQIALYTP